MMWALRVVPQQPVDELLVECFDVVPHEGFVPLEEVVIDGTVESLHMRIHLGRTRVDVEVEHLQFLCCTLKVERKLAPIVGLYGSRTVGNGDYRFAQEVRGAP